jgi:hypothetical protein
MSPHYDSQVFFTLDAARESLYRLADQDPGLSQPLSAATIALTDALNACALGPSGDDPDEAATALLSALNIIAATRDNPAVPNSTQLALAAAFAQLAPLPTRLRSPAAPPRRHLRLVYSS